MQGKDCRDLFQNAYENRYTWGPFFKGYKGRCKWKNEDSEFEGSFSLSKDLKPRIFQIENKEAEKAIYSQLWEVAIHRIKRDFLSVHGANTFIAGDSNDIGLEVIVGGNSKGDRYRIKDNIVTMVHRNIHGKLIIIFTKEVMNTSNGYLSKTYTSQYFNPINLKPLNSLSLFEDSYTQISDNGPFVLSSRTIKKSAYQSHPPTEEQFLFLDLLPKE